MPVKPSALATMGMSNQPVTSSSVLDSGLRNEKVRGLRSKAAELRRAAQARSAGRRPFRVRSDPSDPRTQPHRRRRVRRARRQNGDTVGLNPESAVAHIDNGRFGTHTVRFETGRIAKQAAGSVCAYLDDETMLLSATTASKRP